MEVVVVAPIVVAPLFRCVDVGGRSMVVPGGSSWSGVILVPDGSLSISEEVLFANLRDILSSRTPRNDPGFAYSDKATCRCVNRRLS